MNPDIHPYPSVLPELPESILQSNPQALLSFLFMLAPHPPVEWLPDSGYVWLAQDSTGLWYMYRIQPKWIGAGYWVPGEKARKSTDVLSAAIVTTHCIKGHRHRYFRVAV